MFHAEFVQDNEAIGKEREAFLPFPNFDKGSKDITYAYMQIKKDIKLLVEDEMERMMTDPEMVGLIITK
jgi:hypothetical protein